MRTTVGVSCLVLDVPKRRLLLIRREKPPYQHCWAFPGGHLHPGESLPSAMHREVLEETGYQVSLPTQQLYNAVQRHHKDTSYLVLTGLAHLLHPDPSFPRTPQDQLIHHSFFSYDPTEPGNVYALSPEECIPDLAQIITRLDHHHRFSSPDYSPSTTP